MSDREKETGAGQAEDEELDAEALAAMEAEEPAFKALLKRSLGTAEGAAAERAKEPEDEAQKQRQLLAAVQRKLRDRSKGKFYGDGWSTTQSRVNYALVAAIMLVTIVAVYLALGPMGISLN
jgi:hypothetical protein